VFAIVDFSNLIYVKVGGVFILIEGDTGNSGALFIVVPIDW